MLLVALSALRPATGAAPSPIIYSGYLGGSYDEGPAGAANGLLPLPGNLKADTYKFRLLTIDPDAPPSWRFLHAANLFAWWSPLPPSAAIPARLYRVSSP